MDDYLPYALLFSLKTKSQALKTFIKFKTQFELQFQIKIKQFQFD